MLSGGLWTILCRVAGVTPSGGKTGKREAAWALIAMALGLTVFAMTLGVEMVQAATAVLVALWPSAVLALAGAYKLEFDRQALLGTAGLQSPPAAAAGAVAGYPADIAPPEGEAP